MSNWENTSEEYRLCMSYIDNPYFLTKKDFISLLFKALLAKKVIKAKSNTTDIKFKYNRYGTDKLDFFHRYCDIAITYEELTNYSSNKSKYSKLKTVYFELDEKRVRDYNKWEQIESVMINKKIDFFEALSTFPNLKHQFWGDCKLVFETIDGEIFTGEGTHETYRNLILTKNLMQYFEIVKK